MTTFIKGDPDAPVPDDGTTVVYDGAKGAYVPGPVPGSGTSGPGGTTDHAALTNRSAADQHPIGAITGLQTALDGKAESGHSHTAAQISDATTTGRAVIQASSATAARDAIGAGTSSLQLGTGPTTAAAGNHTHDDRYFTETEADGRFVRTVNGTGPDGSGNVVVSGGGSGGGFTYPPGFHVMPLGPASTSHGLLQAGWVCLNAGHIPGGGTVVGVTVQVVTASAGNPVRLGLYTQTSAGQYALVHDFGAFDPATVGLHTLSGSWAVPAGAYILAAAAAAGGSPSLTRPTANSTPTRTGDFDAGGGRLMKSGIDFSTGLPATISAPAENTGPFPAVRFTYA